MATRKVPPELRNILNNLFAIKTTELESALMDLRIHVKYLLFDNEALRRENEQLRNLLTED